MRHPDAHPNGFLPIKMVGAGAVAWNLIECKCGAPMDFRAAKCRSCYLDERRAKDSKLCPGCAMVRPINDFYRRKGGQVIPRCKACIKLEGAGRGTKHNVYATRSRARRFKRDRAFALGFYLSNTIRIAVREAGGRKSARAEQILGCSIQDFMRYIESMWRPGMSWGNRGRTIDCWQLDHRRPISSFDLRDPAQQHECFHYTNYQPLWAAENKQKGASLSWVRQH